MRLKNVDSEFKKLATAHKEQIKESNKNTVSKMLTDLEDATPVDTGFAKSQWEVVEKGDNFTVKNHAPYIEELNNGHSKQAPTHFIEQIALHYGKPLGIIVDIRQE